LILLDTQFIGEHLGPGKLGHFFVITAFVGALFSCFSYFRAAQTEKTDLLQSGSWLKLGRGSFITHAISIFGIFATLFYIIQTHLFEYHYAWEHSSRSLPPKYLLSCFWEGQEGSFMLWAFWHCVLGLIVMRTSRQMESRTMAVISLVQAALASMLLGFYFGEHLKIGSTPFLLLRDKMAGAPIFSQPNYLSFIEDGNGLNVLLQNYWMVIHPPVLFLGFSATLIPFAYTIATLWKGEYQQWLKPTLIWSLFAGAVLGTGIMMGGAWAYESLTFGGYWAWDPVENASLVPWLILIAGLHTLIIFKATGRTLIATLIFFILTYIMVWYSTFLTRTGVLGDTSVHAFTGEGKSLYWHLIVVMGVLLLTSLAVLIRRWKSLPRVKTEEAIDTREFWMFIGSFVLLLSAMQIIITTSIPVWSPLAKMISGKEVAPPVDPVAHYNGIQVWVAFVLAVLSASILYLRFKSSDMKVVWKRLGITALLGLVLALVIGFTQDISTPQYAALLFSACFSIVANVYYAIAIKKGNFKKMGASIAHLGFGLSLLGIILSSYNKEIISLNTLGVVMDFGLKSKEANAKESRENILLFRNTPVAMADYTLTYKGDSTSAKDPRTFYRVDYQRWDENKKLVEEFTLWPDAFVNPKGQKGLSANPASKHYLTKDVFTYVTSVIDPTQKTDTTTYKSHIVQAGDTIFLNTGYLVFKGFDTQVDNSAYTAVANDIAVMARLPLYDLKGEIKELKPVYYIRDGYESQIEDTAKEQLLYTRLSRVIPDKNAAEIMVKESDPKDDYIVLKAMVFPFINVLWLGIVVMVLGFLIAMWNRITKKDKKQMA
jgi:cytochrome c-type biogenesis protein CcmF